jgi:hypothetical protein
VQALWARCVQAEPFLVAKIKYPTEQIQAGLGCCELSKPREGQRISQLSAGVWESELNGPGIWFPREDMPSSFLHPDSTSGCRQSR